MSLTIFKDCFQTSQQHTRPLGTWVPKLAKHLTLIFIYSQSWPWRNKWDRTEQYMVYMRSELYNTPLIFFQCDGLQHHNDSIIGLHHYNVIKTSWNRFSTCSLSDLVEIYTALVNKADYGRKDANVQACCVCVWLNCLLIFLMCGLYESPFSQHTVTPMWGSSLAQP